MAAPLAQAQDPNGFRLGLKAGATYANAVGGGVKNIASSQYTSSRARGVVGYSAGLTFSIPVGGGGWFAVAPEVLYTRRGYHVNSPSNSTITTLPSGSRGIEYQTKRYLHYFDLPILAHLKTGNFFFELGPQISWLQGAKASSDVALTATANGDVTTTGSNQFPDFTNTLQGESYKSDLRQLDYSGVVGLGLQSRSGLSVTLRYSRGFRSFLDSSGDDLEQIKVYNSTLSLQAGYSLPVGKR
ncbi:hypothetical protein B0919_00400 [Hymenobacter sp. CRA2]|nr:hypothetical protein B0919_00400 [Hymenobacter sp. CRA2]